MKTAVKYILQRILGFKNYLFIFSLFTIYRLKRDKNEKDFLLFLNLIPDGGMVLDIGANIGIMTTHLARKLKRSVIYAYEPIPHNLETLNRICLHFNLKNVRIKEKALGDHTGSVEMVMPVSHSVKMQGLSHVIHESVTADNTGITYTVPMDTLDNEKDFFEEGSKVTAIKIDVENFEYFVLKGASNLLKQHRPIVYCELWENENRQFSIQIMQDLGYTIHVVISGKLTSFDRLIHHTQNFIFLPAGSSAGN
jgi:FkbM family methyltransferase